MRIASIIVATLLLLASAGLGIARSSTNFKDAKAMASVDKDLIAMAKSAKIEGAGALEVKPGALKRGGVGLILTGLLSLALVVSVFVKRGVPIVAGTLLGAALLTIILNPQYEVGALQGMSARSAAIVVAVLAGGGALFAFLADRIRVKRAATA